MRAFVCRFDCMNIHPFLCCTSILVSSDFPSAACTLSLLLFIRSRIDHLQAGVQPKRVYLVPDDRGRIDPGDGEVGLQAAEYG